MFKMKYIIANGLPYLFSEVDRHADIAVMLGLQRDNIEGAGFVYHTKDGLSCYGRSVGLGVDSRPDVDSEIINRFLGLEEN